MTRMRQRIAQRLKDSQNTYAMLTTFNEVDMRLVGIFSMAAAVPNKCHQLIIGLYLFSPCWNITKQQLHRLIIFPSLTYSVVINNFSLFMWFRNNASYLFSFFYLFVLSFPPVMSLRCGKSTKMHLSRSMVSNWDSCLPLSKHLLMPCRVSQQWMLVSWLSDSPVYLLVYSVYRV